MASLKGKQEVRLIDLYKDRFDPVLSAQELSGYNQGRSFDPLVQTYQDVIKQSRLPVFYLSYMVDQHARDPEGIYRQSFFEEHGLGTDRKSPPGPFDPY